MARPDGTNYITFKSAASAAGVTGGVLRPQRQPSVPPPLAMEAQRAVTHSMREVNAAKTSSSVNFDQETSTVSKRLSRPRVAPSGALQGKELTLELHDGLVYGLLSTATHAESPP